MKWMYQMEICISTEGVFLQFLTPCAKLAVKRPLYTPRMKSTDPPDESQPGHPPKKQLYISCGEPQASGQLVYKKQVSALGNTGLRHLSNDT